MAWMPRACPTATGRTTAGPLCNGWPTRWKSTGWRACCMLPTDLRCNLGCGTCPWTIIIWTLQWCFSSTAACFTVTTVTSSRTPGSTLLPRGGGAGVHRKGWRLPEGHLWLHTLDHLGMWVGGPQVHWLQCSGSSRCQRGCPTAANSAWLVVDGRPLLAQPWQPDFESGLYSETYHALLKSSGMYPSIRAMECLPNRSWVAACCCPGTWCQMTVTVWPTYPPDVWKGTVKASLRFTRPLPATMTLMAYAQYGNLVVIDAYHTVTFDYNAWCSAGDF